MILLNGLAVSFCLSFLACSNQKTIKQPLLKIAKTVPLNLKNDADKNFYFHQDTLYYQNNFFTGFRFSLNENGDTTFINSYFNGVLEGVQKKWYDNKRLAEERFYINGKKEGTHQGWWPNGTPKFAFDALDNEYNGVYKDWYATGVLAKQFHYKNGQEEGSQRLWWDNGTVRANYVIRSGKKYGLIGLKLCTNTNDSLFKK